MIHFTPGQCLFCHQEQKEMAK